MPYYANPLTNEVTWDAPFEIYDDREDSNRDDSNFKREVELGNQRSAVISPSQFGEDNPRSRVSGRFFKNIGLFFPTYGTLDDETPAFKLFKRKIIGQSVFCKKAYKDILKQMPASLLTYQSNMNLQNRPLIEQYISRIPSDKYVADWIYFMRHIDMFYARPFTLSQLEQGYEMTPADVELKKKMMNVFDSDNSVIVTWNQLLYALQLEERCEGACEYRGPDKPGMMTVTSKPKHITRTTCGFTAPGIACCMLFLQIVGSSKVNDFVSYSSYCNSHARLVTKTPISQPAETDGIIDNDQKLDEKLKLFNIPNMTTGSPHAILYSRLNTAISQFYDRHGKYQTGISYMNKKRPDLFIYGGLKPGINIISLVDPRTGVTFHHSFIYNAGAVSIIIDSWAHGTSDRPYIFGRKYVMRVWDTGTLSKILIQMRKPRNSTTYSINNVSEIMLKVFLAPHKSNIRYYTGPDYSSEHNELVTREMVSINARYMPEWYIISTNQNFLMTTFLFNFGFTRDILFGGGGIRTRRISSNGVKRTNKIKKIKKKCQNPNKHYDMKYI